MSVSLFLHCSSGCENLAFHTGSFRIFQVIIRKMLFLNRVFQDLSGFDTGKFWKISDDPELISDETKPPRRLTESSIIQKMKKAAIGRPSTYVSTVSKLVDRGYIEKDGSTLIPTDNGRTLWVDVAPFYDNQTDYGDGIFSTEFTAIMEQKLDQTAQLFQLNPMKEFIAGLMLLVCIL